MTDHGEESRIDMERHALNTLEEKVDPRWSAVVVVDMQNDFVSPGGAWDATGEDISMPQEVLPRIIKLIAGARERRVPIIFVRSVYTTDDNRYLSDVFLHQQERRARRRFSEVPVCVEGSWGWQLAPGLEVDPQDTIIVKHRYSAFHSTDLHLRLRSQGTRSILLVGVGTAVCVESTARDGFFLDYYNVIVSDCCGAYDREAHQQAIKRLDLHYGHVARYDEVLQAWA
jgi:ureidoacrylate peracid hydrolase